MSDTNESLNRTNELLQQLLEQERQKAADRQEQMQKLRETVKVEMPKFEGLASAGIKSGFRDPEHNARIEEIKQQAEARHQEEIAFRDRMVALLDEQTKILNEIAAQLRR